MADNTPPQSPSKVLGSHGPFIEDYTFFNELALDQLDMTSEESAHHVVVLTRHLRSQLQTLSALSVQFLKLHKISMENVNEAINDATIDIQNLISKARTLNEELKKSYGLAADIKETRKLLDIFDNHFTKLYKAP